MDCFPSYFVVNGMGISEEDLVNVNSGVRVSRQADLNCGSETHLLALSRTMFKQTKNLQNEGITSMNLVLPLGREGLVFSLQNSGILLVS